MKRLSVLSLCLVSGAALAADPLYVPPANYAYVQPGTPLLTPQPEPQLGSPGNYSQSTVPPTAVSPLAPSAVLPSYPLAVSPLPAISGVPVPLYPNVKVVSAHKKWPGGVTEIVEIPNPLPRSGCCDPVYVPICVPPGCQPSVTVGPRGQRVTYAFGGYRVEVTSLRGVVTIDYDRR